MRFAKTQEDRETKAETFLNDFLPKWLEPMETLLRKRGGVWFAGNGVTFADLGLMVLLDFIHEPEEIAFKDLDNLTARAKILDSFPLVKANYKRTSAPACSDGLEEGKTGIQRILTCEDSVYSDSLSSAIDILDKCTLIQQYTHFGIGLVFMTHDLFLFMSP